MHVRYRYLFPLLAVLCLGLFPPAVLADSFQLQDIRVEGLQRISAGTVFNFVPVKPGDTVDEGRTPEIIRSLYKSGYFKDVRLERDGNVLVISVTERPAIAEINISGNKSIETDDLKQGLKDIGLAEGRTFNRSVLDRIEQELRRQFFNQGKYGVEVTSTVTPLERNRVALDIQIIEGKTATIKSIRIVGNHAFDEKDLLDQFKLTTGGGWLSWFSSDNQYSRQKLAGDLEALRSFYLNRGYVQFKILSTQVTISPDKQDIYVTVNIHEGDVYTIGDIKLAGELVVDAKELFPLIHLRRGEPFSRRAVVQSSDRINRKLADQGYAFANVNSIPETNEKDKTVNLTYFVDPGKRVYVRRINIKGNSKTRDRVIRREFRQMEAAWFSSEKLRLSRERVQRLGFFEDVNVETPAVAGSTDQIDVNVKVKEKPSGAFLAGVGFSQSAGFILNTSVTQENFLGTGKRVTLAFNNSSTSTRYQVSYLNPYYTIDGISRGFDLLYQSTNYDDFSTTNFQTDVATAGVNFGLPLSEFNRLGFGAAVDAITLKVNSSSPQSVKDFQTAEGDRYLNVRMTINWRHDSRDSAIFPKKGGLQQVQAEATVPGSDLQYYRLSYTHKRYIPLVSPLVLSLEGDLGYGDSYSGTSELPPFKKFYAGGVESVRGYRANTLGPRDVVTGDPLGGNLKVVGNVTLLFPPPFTGVESVRLGLFFDVGNVFDTHAAGFNVSDFRYSTGLAVSWLSPLGALNISLAQPLKKAAGDDTEYFQFSFGTTF